jgi:hypothetical protein
LEMVYMEIKKLNNRIKVFKEWSKSDTSQVNICSSFLKWKAKLGIIFTIFSLMSLKY